MRSLFKGGKGRRGGKDPNNERISCRRGLKKLPFSVFGLSLITFVLSFDPLCPDVTLTLRRTTPRTSRDGRDSRTTETNREKTSGSRVLPLLLVDVKV